MLILKVGMCPLVFYKSCNSATSYVATPGTNIEPDTAAFDVGSRLKPEYI